MPRKKSFEPKIGEMKKELRLLRLKECPPISKMKKAEVSTELMRLKGVKDETTRTTAVEGLRKVEAETKARNEERMMEGEKVVKGRKNMAKALEGLRKVETETKERNTGRKKKAEAEKVEKGLESLKTTEKEMSKKMKPLMKLPSVAEGDEAMSEGEEKPKGAKRRKNYVPKQIAPAPKPEKAKPKRGRPSKKIAEKMEVFDPKETPVEKKKRFAKGSEEAKAYMASLRAKKSK